MIPPYPGDTKLENWEKAGLLVPSVCSGILQTIKKDLIVKRIGALESKDLSSVKESLKTAMCSRRKNIWKPGAA